MILVGLSGQWSLSVRKIQAYIAMSLKLIIFFIQM